MVAIHLHVLMPHCQLLLYCQKATPQTGWVNLSDELFVVIRSRQLENYLRKCTGKAVNKCGRTATVS